MARPRWVSFLAVVGAFALAAALYGLFAPFGQRPAQLQPTAAPPVDSPEFLSSVAGIAGTPLRAGGTVRLLDNGDQFFPALLAAIRGARRTINFLVYIWEPGRAADEVFAALVERARAGVQVRLLLDGFGCLLVPRNRVDELKAAGGKVAVFRPPRFGKLTVLHKRQHRRAIVIDAQVGFAGGMAVKDVWLGNADRENRWRDSMVEATGPFAITLQSHFVQPWAFASGELLVGPEFFPVSPPGPAPAGPLHVGLASSPTRDEHPLRLFYVQSFQSARKRIWVATPYFVPDRATREVLAERARQGVDVRLLVPGEHIDATLVRRAAQGYYEELLAAGARIYEYQPTFMHNKVAVIDGLWSIVGSANLDIRAKEQDEENVLGILDQGFAGQVEASFLTDLARSEEIKLDRWRGRGPWVRFREHAASLLAEQY